MRAFRALRWVALGMAIGGLTFGAVTARAANKLDNQPFSGVLTGTSTGTPSSVTIVGSVSSGSINATHLGNGTYTLTVTEDYERMQDEEHPTGNCGFVEDGKNTPATAGLVITAANGDQLFGALDDDRSVICAPDTQTIPQVGDVYLSTLYIVVNGGTGRFSDATGWLFSRGNSTLTTFDSNTGVSTSNDQGVILGDIHY